MTTPWDLQNLLIVEPDEYAVKRLTGQRQPIQETLNQRRLPLRSLACPWQGLSPSSTKLPSQPLEILQKKVILGLAQPMNQPIKNENSTATGTQVKRDPMPAKDEVTVEKTAPRRGRPILDYGGASSEKKESTAVVAARAAFIIQGPTRQHLPLPRRLHPLLQLRRPPHLQQYLLLSVVLGMQTLKARGLDYVRLVHRPRVRG